MIIDSPIVSGSQLASGPLTQIGNVQITGSLSVTGAINGSITGSITSASYATYAETASYAVGYALDNNVVHLSGNQSIAGEKSFDNVVTIYESSGIRFTDNPLTTNYGSIQGNQYFWQFTAGADTLLFRSKNSVNALSVDAAGNSTMTSVTANSFTGSLLGTASYAANANSTSASFAAYSASVSTRLTTDEANITTLTSASGSFAAQSASLSTRITQDETNFTNLSSSFATTSGSLSTRVTNLESTSSTVSSSFASTSGSIAGRVTLIEGQYATTGSNTFTNLQYISATTNAQGFTTTASLYTDGGLRVSKDSYVSGTAYFNNVVVYGTSSIQYLTSSQVNVGANIINLNTQTPAVRYGGMAVADSGSNPGVTGSMLWDSVYNRWIYSNPSGSTYDGGMIISGPRNTSGLGNELGTTACALMMGQGGDHITSSAIFSYDNATCFYGNSYVSSSGLACFAGTVCAPAFVGGTVGGTVGTFSSVVCSVSGGDYWRMGVYSIEGHGNGTGGTWSIGTNSNDNLGIITNNTQKIKIDSNGVSCFLSTICSPSVLSSGTICSTGNTCFGGMTIVANCLGVGTSTPAYKVQVAVAQNSGGAVANRNSCSGTAAYAAYFLGNDAADNGGGITLFSSVYTPANSYPIDGTYVYSNRPGGVAIIAEHVTSALSLGAGNCSRMCISSVGITSFTCQVCTPNLISTDATHTTLRMGSAIVPLSNYRTSDCGYGGIDFFDNGKGYACAAKFYTFKSVSSAEYYGFTNDYNGSAQLALVSCGGGAGNNISLFTGTSTTARLRIDNNVSCFSQTVCAPLLVGRASSQQIMAIGDEADIWMCNTGGGAGLWRLLGSTGNAIKLFRIYDGNAGSNRLTINSDGLVCTPFGVKFGNGSGQLNYYEEGSWTPTLQNATVSYDFRSGSYIRIGNYVFVRWGFRISSISGQSGTVQISGLPFTAVNWGSYQEPNVSVSTGVLATADYAQRARLYKGGNDTSLYGRIADNGDTSWNTSQLQNGSWIIGEIFYNVP